MHDHAGQPRHNDLPLSVMAQSAFARVGVTLLVLAALWLAVAWAIALP